MAGSEFCCSTVPLLYRSKAERERETGRGGRKGGCERDSERQSERERERETERGGIKGGCERDSEREREGERERERPREEG